MHGNIRKYCTVYNTVASGAEQTNMLRPAEALT